MKHDSNPPSAADVFRGIWLLCSFRYSGRHRVGLGNQSAHISNPKKSLSGCLLMFPGLARWALIARFARECGRHILAILGFYAPAICMYSQPQHALIQRCSTRGTSFANIYQVHEYRDGSSFGRNGKYATRSRKQTISDLFFLKHPHVACGSKSLV